MLTALIAMMVGGAEIETRPTLAERWFQLHIECTVEAITRLPDVNAYFIAYSGCMGRRAVELVP